MRTSVAGRVLGGRAILSATRSNQRLIMRLPPDLSRIPHNVTMLAVEQNPMTVCLRVSFGSRDIPCLIARNLVASLEEPCVHEASGLALAPYYLLPLI